MTFVGEHGHKAIITQLCRIVSIVYFATDPECRHASDGFCDECPNTGGKVGYFRHDGKTIDFIKEAIRLKLEYDGIPIPEGFDEL
ncbi:hypothetical protein UFOVP1229_135 [uncultured Caudovirales phage]|uniref:Uncharacterized protein n=1 Tax=uncultured Caudovirales phage TaxID=2100421 RepID=A0A6J5RDL6_9CAUD|nr:hypothetical protein UFOVP1229_135 [uncultured Caudovirales phage]